METTTNASAQPDQVETFVWRQNAYDISAILRDIKSQALRPEQSELPKAFIDSYSTQVLALERKKRGNQQAFGIWVSVDAAKADALPLEVLNDPVLMLYAGKNKGLLNIDGTGSHYILADGNHRTARAFFDEKDGLPVYVLSQEQTRRYKLS